MEALLGFRLDFWDYATFASLFIITVGFLGLAVFILGLPGRIAIARNHPEADAIYLMGWIGFLAVVPWIQALIWAFKPTDVIDIRHLPAETQRETELMIARLSGRAPPPAPASPEIQHETEATIAQLSGQAAASSPPVPKSSGGGPPS
jgi:uncharacterized protein DUF3302